MSVMIIGSNNVKRLIVVGDIHGCQTKLVTLMEIVNPSEEDLFVFVGDYIDRGPDSKGVIDYLIRFVNRLPRTVFLKGNHEDMLLRVLAGEVGWLEQFVCNGGLQTIDSYGSLENIPVDHLQFFKELTAFYETDDFFITHAGVDPEKELNEQDEHDLLWIREPFLTSDRNFGKTIVHGHSPRPGPEFVEGQRINLDTGAVYSSPSFQSGGLGWLTAMNILTGQFWQVNDETIANDKTNTEGRFILEP